MQKQHGMSKSDSRKDNDKPTEVQYNLIILPEQNTNKVQLLSIKFERRTEPSISYEPLNDTSILLEFLKSQPEFIELFKKLLVVTFSKQMFSDKIYNSLKNGIKLSDSKQIYRYLGHSNSKLRDEEGKSCFLMPADTNVKVFNFIDQFSHDFISISNIEKQAKRIAQLFSRFNYHTRLRTDEFKLIRDVQNKYFIFTDGCGFMSTKFANHIKSILKIDYTPSVCQIRYRGFKGVLLHVPELDVKVHFRDSMKKFDTIMDNLDVFGIVDYSKRFRPAYLNTQTIMLLESIGVLDRVLKMKQKEFFKILDELIEYIDAARKYLTCLGYQELLDEIREKQGFSPGVVNKLKSYKKKETDKMCDLKLDKPKYKNHILIPQSRLVFGVCDPYGLLEKDECYFKPSLLKTDQGDFDNADIVLVTRNPCYSPGDMRKLKLANKKLEQYYKHLFDCIVFSVRGDRAIADQMSGGDLDGDQFMVIWDIDLIPRNIAEPELYKDLKDAKHYTEYKPDYRIGNIIEPSNDSKIPLCSNVAPFRHVSIESQPSSKKSSISEYPDKNNTEYVQKLYKDEICLIEYPINFICFCGESFNESLKGLENKISYHFKNFHNEIKYIYKCAECPYTNEKFRGLNGHYQTHLSSKKINDVIPDKEAVNSNLSNFFGNESTIYNNNNISIDKAFVKYPIDFICCNKHFDEKMRLKEKAISEHFIESHRKIVVFVCSKCKKEFEGLKGVSLHFTKCNAFENNDNNKRAVSTPRPELESERLNSRIKSITDANENLIKPSKQVVEVLRVVNSCVLIRLPINCICFCGQEFIDKKNIEKILKEHFSTNHKGVDYIINCRNCDYSGDFHMVSCHYGNCKKTILVNSIENEDKVSFDKKPENQEHKLKVKEKEKRIEESPYTHSTIKSDTDFNNLEKIIVDYPINFECTCGEKIGKTRKNKKEALLDHFRNKHPTWTFNFRCTKCGEEFAEFDEVEYHFQTVQKCSKETVPIAAGISNNINKRPIEISNFNLTEANDMKKEHSKERNRDSSIKRSDNDDYTKNKMRDKLINYFSFYDSSLVGRLNSLFMRFAAIKGPECDECVKLNKYLSLALDMSTSADEVQKLMEDYKEKVEQCERAHKAEYVQKYKAWSDMEEITKNYFSKSKN